MLSLLAIIVSLLSKLIINSALSFRMKILAVFILVLVLVESRKVIIKFCFRFSLAHDAGTSIILIKIPNFKLINQFTVICISHVVIPLLIRLYHSKSCYDNFSFRRGIKSYLGLCQTTKSLIMTLRYSRLVGVRFWNAINFKRSILFLTLFALNNTV